MCERVWQGLQHIWTVQIIAAEVTQLQSCDAAAWRVDATAATGSTVAAVEVQGVLLFAGCTAAAGVAETVADIRVHTLFVVKGIARGITIAPNITVTPAQVTVAAAVAVEVIQGVGSPAAVTTAAVTTAAVKVAIPGQGTVIERPVRAPGSSVPLGLLLLLLFGLVWFGLKPESNDQGLRKPMFFKTTKKRAGLSLPAW